MEPSPLPLGSRAQLDHTTDGTSNRNVEIFLPPGGLPDPYQEPKPTDHMNPERSARTEPALTDGEAMDLWEHSSLLFHQNSFTDALIHTRVLLRRATDTHPPVIPRYLLWANIAILRAHLGEYRWTMEALHHGLLTIGHKLLDMQDGQQTIQAQTARQTQQDLANGGVESPAQRQNLHRAACIAHTITDLTKLKGLLNYLAGCAAFELRDLAGSARLFTKSIAILDELFANNAAASTSTGPLEPNNTAAAAAIQNSTTASTTTPSWTSIHFAPLGLHWTLDRTRVDWNVRLVTAEHEFDQGVPGAELIAGKRWGINRMPAGIFFEPPPRQFRETFADLE